MTMPAFDAMIQLPFSCILSGPSNSDKLYLIKMLLENGKETMSVVPEYTAWCYTCWQPLYDEIMTRINVNFLQGRKCAMSNYNLPAKQTYW